jgi:hypothetical protein
MRRNKAISAVFIPFLSLTLAIGGCAPVIERIQQTTGNRIEKVDQLSIDDTKPDEAAKNTPPPAENLPKTPAPNIDLKDILNDDGVGEFSGDRFDQAKVNLALDRMPKGLSEDKVYAYLLGLVGENYRTNVEGFDRIKERDYGEKVAAWRDLKGKEPAFPQPNPSGKPAKQPEAPKPPKKANIVLLLDASASMKGTWNGKAKMDWTQEAIKQFAASLPANTSVFQLRVFGHKGSGKKEDKELSCSSTEKVYATVPVNPAKLNEALSKVKPTGYTPLALALFSAGQDFIPGAPAAVENRVLIISDGSENCGGDPVQIARQLHRSGMLALVHVIGLNVDADAEDQLRKVAESTGGDYVNVTNADELKRVLSTYVQSLSKINDPWPVREMDALAQAHFSDEKRLDSEHQAMVNKVEQEYRRLDHANDYIKAKGKIDGNTWIEIGNWIDRRWQQLGHYADQRWLETSQQLDDKWKKENEEVKKDWLGNGGKKEDFNRLLQQYLKADQELEQARQAQTRAQTREGRARVEVGTEQTE